ncbi:Adenylate cyclase [Diplonema papillatum]|nr:Adenylate cyclase [Diplonema papillatum]
MPWAVYTRFNRWLELPGEPEIDRWRKKGYLYLSLVVVVLSVIVVAQDIDIIESPSAAVTSMVNSCAGALVVGTIFVFRRFPYWMMVFVTLVYSATIIVTDLDAATRGTDRWWPLFVLILDLLLVSRARRLAIAVVYIVVLWLVVITAEQAWRFGLFDLPGLRSYSSRIEVYEEEYVCEKPPCATGLKNINSLTTQLAIFILDFVLTRYFCDQMMSERAQMETAVHAANDIASALAAFDLPRAQESLNAASSRNMPIELTEALEKLLENLSTYRPYLPDAIFNDGELGEPQTLIQTPPGLRTDGAGDGVATILFTDIVSSTAIWNASPVHMKRALRLHNSLIRKALAEYGGYEVKTIGDSFMAAFSTATDAVMFALTVHAKLYTAPWSSDILNVPQCSVVNDTWRGLRIRIGMHEGPVSIEKNTVIDRYDYFGPTVNLAARLESKCVPGCVGALPELVAEVRKSWTSACTTAVGRCCPPPVRPLSSQSHFAFGTEELAGLEDWNAAVSVRDQTTTLKGIGEVIMNVFTPVLFSARLLPVSASVRIRVRDFEEEDEFERTLDCSEKHRPVAAPSGWTLEAVPNATFASVTLEMFDHCAAVGSFQRAAGQTLQTTVQAINKTDGTLMTLLGNAVFVSWNASRRVTAHVQNSFHFTRLVRRSVSSRLRTHISSGKVYAGSVGTEGQRFFTVFGGCVELTRSLAGPSVNVGAIFCPHSPGYIEGRQRADLRPIGWCRLPVHHDDATDYIVYQVSLQDDESDEGASDWGWSPEYWRLFIARDFVAIRRKFQECDDATLQHALSAWARPAHESRGFVNPLQNGTEPSFP